MKNKFDFFQEVIIKETPFTRINKINGLKGAVIGLAGDEFGNWAYGVSIDGIEEGYDLAEELLQPTGFFRKEEDYFTGESIQVEVDPETNEGFIKDSE